MDQDLIESMGLTVGKGQKSVADYFLLAQPHMPLKMTKKVYRKFLEESGVVPELTKVLYKLYDEKEKPPYFIHYFKKYFGETTYDVPNIYHLRQELEKAKARLQELQNENHSIKQQLCRYENYWELKPFDYRY
uniref:c-Myc-binding protein n=1 Tax=Lygus hesperus TaxID=30085 RepID=A0A0A9XVY1_LYGHE